MHACPEFSTRKIISAGQPTYDTRLVAQLGRVRRELQEMLVIAAQMPGNEPYDAAFLKLRRDIDVLGRRFLRLTAKLLEPGMPADQEECDTLT